MKDKTKLASAVTPHKYTVEEFTKKYNDLCKETGFQIAFEPRWRQSQEPPYDYRLVIVSGVVPFVENG